MPSPSLSRLAGRSFVAITCALMLAVSIAVHAASQSSPPLLAHLAPRDVTPLDAIVVSASRTPQALKYTPSSLTAHDLAYLESAQITSLQETLDRTPGISLVSLGGQGGQASVYIRGSEADHVLFIVDGVRMNSAQAGYTNFLGSADLSGLERFEILRGPQSTLYGSSAIGGVIVLETAAAGPGAPEGRAHARIGSFDTFSGGLAVRGTASAFGYSASLAHDETDNFRPGNGSSNLSYTARLERSVLPQLLLGATLRGQDAAYDEIGSTLFIANGRAATLNHLGTVFAHWSPAATFASRLTAGWHQNEYHWTDRDFGPSADFYFRNTRQVLDWQNTWDASAHIRLVAGANAEWSNYATIGQDLRERLASAYLSASFQPLDRLTIDAGLRTDDYDFTTRADTWRAGVSYRIEKTATKLRATYGTGFKAPTVVNRFGSPPWYGANPAIGPEKSTGWDAGFDQEILGDKLAASVTYFQNRFRDLILSAYDFTSGTYLAENIRRARADGVELALTARPFTPLTVRAAYTYTAAFDTSTAPKTRLPRRPRHITDLDAQYQATAVWLVGAGLHFEADRVLSPTIRIENFTTTRLYTNYALNESVTVKVRIENALDEEYAEVGGYPSAPRAIYTSLDWKF